MTTPEDNLDDNSDDNLDDNNRWQPQITTPDDNPRWQPQMTTPDDNPQMTTSGDCHVGVVILG
jgi:hypothetical protein